MYVVNITEDNIDILCVIKKKFVDEIYLYLIIRVDLKSALSYFVVVGILFCILGFSIKPHAYNSS